MLWLIMLFVSCSLAVYALGFVAVMCGLFGLVGCFRVSFSLIVLVYCFCGWLFRLSVICGV